MAGGRWQEQEAMVIFSISHLSVVIFHWSSSFGKCQMMTTEKMENGPPFPASCSCRLPLPPL